MYKVSVITNVSFSLDVYRDPNRPSLPEGWQVLVDCPQNFQKDGYFGSAYYAEASDTGETVRVTIAHRGTNNLKGGIEDYQMWHAQTIPQQFYSSAIPFIQYVFTVVDQRWPTIFNKNGVYKGSMVYFNFSGHSLGAGLAELSMVKYVHYFDNDKTTTYNPCRGFTWPGTDVFDSPGTMPLIQQQIDSREISEEDYIDGAKFIIIHNSDVDIVNTCLPASSLIHSSMGENYTSISDDINLPYVANFFYFSAKFSLNDQHRMKNIYDYFYSENRNTHTLDNALWPIGLGDAYFFYKSYFAQDGDDYFYKHNNYWNLYTSMYWKQNEWMWGQYDNNPALFKEYYYQNVLNYRNAYALPREVNYKFDAADISRIERILYKERNAMQFRAPTNHSKKEEKSSRICCGISFFPAADSLHSTVSSVADTASRIVTETGEELSQVVSTANSTYREGQYLFFVQVDRLLNGGEQKLPTLSRNQHFFGMKK